MCLPSEGKGGGREFVGPLGVAVYGRVVGGRIEISELLTSNFRPLISVCASTGGHPLTKSDNKGE